MEPSSWPEHFRNLAFARRELALPPAMEDDYNASFSGALFFGQVCHLNDRARMRRWLGAGCALTLICACNSWGSAFAQDSASSSKTSPAKPEAKPASATK